jgi:hypothetical protein
MNNQIQPQIDLSQSTEILSSTGGRIFQTGYVLRRVSKFLAQTDEDLIVPIQIFYDKDSGEIALDMLHPDIRHFYQ